MRNYKTEQEFFWAGEFGSNYISRNNSDSLLKSNVAFFSQIMKSTSNVNSVIEFGANIGMNIVALQKLISATDFSAIEINADAVEYLRQIEGTTVYHSSILDFSCDYQRDFVFTKTVLIHINPDSLPAVYDLMHNSSKRYICIAEYYNPYPVEIDYRGHTGKLYKRDFAGDMLDRFSDLKLLDYGFAYHRDNNFPQDDIAWFLLEKGR